MQFWTGIALAIGGWFVPLILSTSGATITIDNYGNVQQKKPSVSYGSYDSYRPVPLTKTVLPVQKKCSQNEELAYCRPYCEATCEHDCKGVPPPKTCIPEPSCVCKDGFVRHNGRCIQKCDCPRRNLLPRHPVSGEYIDFEVVSMEGMRSDEDFDYPLPQPRVTTNERAFSRYVTKKPAMLPVYLRTVSNEPKSSGSCGCKGHTTEKPELFPPLCACRGGKQHTPAPTYVPKLDENASFESTEEDSDIVPYVPPLPTTNSYAPRPLTPLFPPGTQPAPVPHYAHRKTLPMPTVHRADLNEPLDHFYGSGQATSAQQNSAGQEEPERKPMTIWPPEPTLYTIKGMCILDYDGNRILAKYYDKNIFPTVKEQKAYEKNLFSKTHRADAEIIMLDGLTCVYKSNVDLFFYVMGSTHENELILLSVLNCLYDTITMILKKNFEKRAVLENLDIVMLAFDEICDGGIILDADPASVMKRVDLRNDDIPIGEQTVAQVLQSAKEQLKWSLLK
ncbi:AGAP006522-PA-like protein [Anopheles sinensis]|uniref:AGAP006522-PA-like protein n=1 Tax=Anopheles sinensis TaxID=74873 RepID=A0A084WMK8_ANOSI|nr:AGAP006522-PA-like protein [Anopheles sinensis]